MASFGRIPRALAAAWARGPCTRAIPSSTSPLTPPLTAWMQGTADFTRRERWFSSAAASAGESGDQRQPRAQASPRCTTLAEYNKQLRVLRNNKRRGYMHCMGLLEEMTLDGLRPDEEAYISVIMAAMRGKQMQHAQYFFREMCTSGIKPTPLAFNLMINTCAMCGKAEEAFEFSELMEQTGIMPDLRTFQSLLLACAQSGNIDQAQNVVARMEEAGLQHNPSTAAHLITTYSNKKPPEPELQAECEAIMQAARRFDVEKRVPAVVYNSMIEACIAFNSHDRAREMLDTMAKHADGPPKPETLHAVVTMYLHKGQNAKAVEVLKATRPALMAVHSDTYLELLRYTLRSPAASRVDDACALLHTFLHRERLVLNSEAMNMLLSLASGRGQPSLQLAHQLWEHLVRHSIVPDTVAVVPYLRALETRHPEMRRRIANVKEVINMLTEHKLMIGEKDETIHRSWTQDSDRPTNRPTPSNNKRPKPVKKALATA